MFRVELVKNNQTALILTNSFGKVYKLLVEILRKKKVEVFTGRPKSKTLSDFNYVFFINPEFKQFKTFFPYLKNTLVIFTYKNPSLEKILKFLKKKKKKNIKIAGVSPFQAKNHLERALWFLFSESDEIYLPLQLSEKKRKKINLSIFKNLKETFNNWFSLKKFVFLGFLGFLFYNFAIWFFSLLSFGFVFSSLSQPTKEKVEKAKFFFKLSQKMYLPVKSFYHFFFIGSYSDNFLNAADISIELLRKNISLSNKLPRFFMLAFKSSVSLEEYHEQIELLNSLKKDFSEIEKEVNFLISFLPKFSFTERVSQKLKDIQEYISLGKNLLDIYDNFFPKEEKREYILLFANNMELRPGGGFIGSFAIIKTRPLGIESVKFYDVYDADGQLKVHIEPPEAIKKYLNQPHWFLRDSNFSPDMFENYLAFKNFLKYEMPELKINGAILITTSAVKELLKAYGGVYLPDYKEKITADNFYIKTQFYAQNDFFPGALNKKRFLQAIVNELIVEFENVDLITFFKALKNSLDQKFIVAYFEEKGLQEFFDKNYWSGRVIKPDCYVKGVKDCILDYIFPVDANLGVNKANFYIKKSLSLNIKITASGEIFSQLKYTLKNSSPLKVFPGGPYKNYFRLFLLKNIEPQNFEIKPYSFPFYTDKLAFSEKFIVIPVKSKKSLDFFWKNPRKLKKGTNLYQIILQKQIGGANFDFSFKITLPYNVYLVNQNFKPLVKKGKVLYNTYLSNDKIFFLELVKE